MTVLSHLFYGSILCFVLFACTQPYSTRNPLSWQEIETKRIMAKVPSVMKLETVTVTAHQSERSSGDIHDFYSEGDYWWPNPEDPDGPYIRRDGETNPNNFVAHRESMMRLTDIVATLASAYVVTRDDRYAKEATKHLVSWFVDPTTKMHPSLEYGQAIKGRHTGRSIGVIDTLHLVGTARAIKAIEQAPSYKPYALNVREWFAQYLLWLNSHPYGLEEKVHPNNHGASWSLQAAAFARVAGDPQNILPWIRKQFKQVYLKEMMNSEGGFTDELNRTKPYGYSLFMIDVMGGLAELASTEQKNLWTYNTETGLGMALGMDFIYPFIVDKNAWPYPKDILYWDDWPVRQSSLLFASLELNRPAYIATWKALEADPKVYEVKRNMPIRYPLLWE